MSKVFIINEPHKGPSGQTKPSYDVSPAMQHGEIRFIFTTDQFPSPSDNLAKAVDHAWEVLEDYNSLQDHVVWAGGDPISMLIVAPILFEISGGAPIRYLKFERARGDGGRKLSQGYYVPRILDVFGEDNYD